MNVYYEDLMLLCTYYEEEVDLADLADSYDQGYCPKTQISPNIPPIFFKIDCSHVLSFVDR